MEDLVPICSPHKQPTDSLPLLQLRKGPTFYQWNTETTQSNSLLCKTDHEKTCKSGMHTLFGCMWYLGKYSTFYWQTALFTCHAENISCKNLSSRSGLAVTNHCQHSTAVIIACSVKSSTCDHATTCSRLRYTPKQWNYAISYINWLWK